MGVHHGTCRTPTALRRAVPWAAMAACAGLLHRLGVRSGVTGAEHTSLLPGDGVVAAPMWQSTRGVTIHADAADVWPWLVQMGFPTVRAGWYTPRLLDRVLFGIRAPSADVVRPELQGLRVGDRVPDSADGHVHFTVVEVRAPAGGDGVHALVLHSTTHVMRPIRTIDFSWAFVLRPVRPGVTRLLIRARARYTPRRARWFAEAVIGPADFVNVEAMLRGVRRRAEGRGRGVLGS